MGDSEIHKKLESISAQLIEVSDQLTKATNIILEKDIFIQKLCMQITNLQEKLEKSEGASNESDSTLVDDVNKRRKIVVRSGITTTVPIPRANQTALSNNNAPEIEKTSTPMQQDQEPNNETGNQNLTYAEVLSTSVENQNTGIIKSNNENNKQAKSFSPIEVEIANNDERTKVQLMLAQNVDVSGYTFTNTKKSIRINPVNEDIHGRVKDVLKFGRIPFVTFTPKATQKNAFIMRGLPSNSIDEVGLLDVFIKNGYNVISCKPFQTGFSKKNGTSTNLWQIIGNRDLTLEKLGDIKFVLNAAVKFEHQKRKGAIQCKNCQGFMHTAANCFKQYKCVKCGQSHDVGICPITDYNSKRIRCANCGKQHTANNLNACEFFKKNILPLSKRNSLRQVSSFNNENTKTVSKSNDLKAKQNTTKQDKQNLEKHKEIDGMADRIEQRILNRLLQLLRPDDNANTSTENKKKKKKKNTNAKKQRSGR